MTTFPRLMLAHTARQPSAPAMREKYFGVWQILSRRDLTTLVHKLTGRLLQARMKRGDHLIVMGENRPRLYATMLAAQSLGVIPVRREFIGERYGVLIDAPYNGRASQYIESAVRFEDGRTDLVSAELRIIDARIFAASSASE